METYCVTPTPNNSPKNQGPTPVAMEKKLKVLSNVNKSPKFQGPACAAMDKTITSSMENLSINSICPPRVVVLREGDDDISDVSIPGSITDITHLVPLKRIPHQGEVEVQDALKTVTEKMDDKKDGSLEADFSLLIMQISSYVASIMVAENLDSYITATMQFVVSIAGRQMADRMWKRSSVVKNQGPSEALSSLLSFVRGARTLQTGFSESPIYMFFQDALGIVSICGFCKGIKFRDLEVVSAEYMERVATLTVSDFPSAVLRSFEFGIEVARDFCAGVSLRHFMYGRGVLTQTSELLAKEQEFQRGMLKKNHDTTDASFSSQIKLCLVNLEEYVKRSYGSAKSMAIAYRAKLKQLDALVDAKISATGFRKVPFCLMFEGMSGVGKSTLLAAFYQRFSAVFGVNMGPENCVTVNESDKFDPVTGKTTCVTFDDMGQLKDPTKLQVSPLANLVRYVNCVPTNAVKAEVHEKDSIPIEPELVVITTNVATLGATQLTKSPQAIFNRVHMALRVRPKKEFRNPNGSLDTSKVIPGVCPHEVSEISFKVSSDGKVTTIIDEKAYVDYELYFPCIMKRAAEHREKQEAAERRFVASKDVRVCRSCFALANQCKCDKPDFATPKVENQGLVECSRAIYNWMNKSRDSRERAGRSMMKVLTFTSHWTTESETINYYLLNRATSLATEFVWLFLARHNSFILCTVLLWLFVFLLCDLFCKLLMIIWTLYFFFGVVLRTKQTAVKIVMEDVIEAVRDGVPAYGATILDLVFLFPVVAAALTLFRTIVANTTFVMNEGNLAPTSIKEVDERNVEPNEWVTREVVRSDLVASHKARTTTSCALRNKLSKFTYRFSICAKDPTKRVKCVMLRIHSNWAILPKHSFKLMDTSACGNAVLEENVINGTREVRFQMESVQEVGRDHVAVICVGLHTTGSILDYFPDTIAPGRLQVEIVLPGKGVEEPPTGIVQYKDNIGMESGRISGFAGNMRGDTSRGDCCAPWISVGPVNTIIGLHNGRVVDYCCSESILRSDLQFVHEVIKIPHEGVEVPISAPPPLYDIETVMYDEDLFDSEEIHPRSAVNFGRLSDDGRTPIVEVYGSVKHTRARNFSRITETILSEPLSKQGLEQKWKSPNMDANVNFAISFQKAQHPIKPINPTVLVWAMLDYVCQLVSLVHSMGAYFRPLSLYEAINGRYESGQVIKSMNVKTSAGLGLKGTKDEHLIEFVGENGYKSYGPTDYIEEEVLRILDKLKNGQRVCPISKGTLKDEAIPKEKKKTRIFFVMPMAFLIVGRMLLACIVAFLASVPLASECWFGVRTTTDEWAQCYDHLNRWGGNHCLNGDYSGYDQTISQQLIWAVGQIMQILATAMGFPVTLVTAIAAWFADVANPIYAFNGTLMSFFGYQPSGNPLTIIINCIVNSLLFRCFFYEKWMEHFRVPPTIGVFRKFVAAGFVGDDSALACDPKLAWFNMCEFQKWLANLGMKYTMPDKKDTVMVPWIPLHDLSLCKRTFRVVKYAFKTVVWAPIEPDSIMKSLHNLHKSHEDQWLVLTGNVTQGLRELSRHPHEVFHYYVSRIRAAINSIPHPPIPELEWTYDDWQSDILDRYDNRPIQESVEEQDAAVQLGHLDTIFE